MINRNEKNILDNQLQQSSFSDYIYIYKSYNLIESKYNFNINEQRLVHLAIKKILLRYIDSNLKKSQINTYLINKNFENIKIYVTEYKHEFNINSNAVYKILEKTASDLSKKTLEYLQYDSTYITKKWMNYCKYNSNERCIELTFNPELILDLLPLKDNFIKLKYLAIKNFKRFYSFRIYELLQNNIYENSRIISVQELKEKLEIELVKYQKISFFKAQVLEPALEEINNLTNLQVSYELLRQGRNIKAIVFNVNLKSANIVINDNKKLKPEIYNKVVNIISLRFNLVNDLSEEQVKELIKEAMIAIKKYNINMDVFKYIEYQVDNIYYYCKTAKVKNCYDYLLIALKKYWKENKEVFS